MLTYTSLKVTLSNSYVINVAREQFEVKNLVQGNISMWRSWESNRSSALPLEPQLPPKDKILNIICLAESNIDIISFVFFVFYLSRGKRDSQINK